MNVIQKSEAIKNGLRKGFQDGSSKMARRKCYGYEVGPDGDLTVNSEPSSSAPDRRLRVRNSTIAILPLSGALQIRHTQLTAVGLRGPISGGGTVEDFLQRTFLQ